MPVRTNIKLKVGPVATTVSIDSGVVSSRSDVTVCLGQPGHEHDEPHAVRRPQQCPTCGPVVDVTRTAKARKSGSTYQVLPTEDVKAISAEHSEKFKDPAFAPYPREQVEAGTVAGEKLYYLTPTGVPENYANIRSMIRENPDLSFVGFFTPKGAAAVFTLEVRGEALVLVERVLASNLKPLPQIDAAPDAFEEMCVAAVKGMVTDFDPTAFTNARAEALAEAFASSDMVAEVGVTRDDAPSAPADAEMADELARLIAASQKKTPARKAAEKVVAQKKAAPRKTTTRKPAAAKVA